MAGSDRLIPLLRFSFLPLVVLTAIFGPALVLFSTSTASFWSWEIKPAMSAVWVGAGYTFGAFAITTMLLVGKWRSAIVAVIATWPFSIVMLLATLLHLERFFLGTINFYVWFIIYLALPLLLPLIWWLNRAADPGPQPGDVLLPARLIAVGRVLGVIVLLAGLLLVVSPGAAAGFWPWTLTPLLARVIGGWVIFMGTALACLAFERRYVVYRYFLPCAGLWMTILFLASFFHLDNFNFSRAGSWIWFILIGGVAAGIFALYFYLERLYRGAQAPAIAPAG